MEKNHGLIAPKLTLPILLIAIAMFHGLSHGSHVDQAGRLRALWWEKRQLPRNPTTGEEWTLASLGHEALFFGGGKMEDDLISGGLPGQPKGVGFKQYAGYVNVNGASGRSLFYYFAEAVQDPSSKPLVLWLNGGPGCSSLGMGAMVEIGPFGVKPDGKTLYSRRHAWNRVANMLFLESPAGVGFSYSNTTSDYTTSGDKRTALDTYNFLISWFRRYPHYKSSDFYIAGESYAGFYIPELADIIINRNRLADTASTIHLKGILVGNGIINDATDQKGYYDYVWSHALISDETYLGLVEHCLRSNSSKCDDYVTKIGTDAGKIDFDNIYGTFCIPSNSSNTSRQARGLGGYDPCEVYYVHKYLNLPQVQEALHANVTKLPYTWELCSNLIGTWTDSPSTMLPIYRRLIASGLLRILLYSGDTDAVVPVSGTRYAIDALNLRVIKPWHPWSDGTDEVCGYTVVYDGLTFTTVRGAGHQVPQCQPCKAFALFKMFVTAEQYSHLSHQR
ncbi:Serine carboxypeptidase-like [Actinidia chinensis var. chinensis]|uniref:Carboxypeptidase n=1 Tax=Actinidia chinensis var. chinensis TaxID=1590841 RepID=A0A2R6RC14_ACTCC|nr:Serine carboxypeptidase-like [Actinidia chinensis var. chinensis]